MQGRRRRLAFLLLALASLAAPSVSQEAKKLAGDVSVPNVNGIFIDPVPNAPFSGVLEITSRQKLSDGSFNDLKTINCVARDSVGRTYQEGRHFVADQYQGEPPLQSFRIYDPNAELETRLDPFTFIARQVTRKEAKPAPGLVPAADAATANPPVKVEDLGTKTFDGVTLRGTRQTKSADTFDEYWYSADLALYLIRKHVDPKWEQTFTLTKLDRSEPDPARFVVPKSYRIAEGPAPAPSDQGQPSPPVNGIYHVGGGVSPPRVVHSVEPQYSEQARAAKINGICVLALVVGIDGIPQNVHVIRKLGSGLDQKAIEAVSAYRFEPAMFQGKPVPVEVNIEVNFQIYK
jgi:TonB family protein